MDRSYLYLVVRMNNHAAYSSNTQAIPGPVSNRLIPGGLVMFETTNQRLEDPTPHGVFLGGITGSLAAAQVNALEASRSHFAACAERSHP